MMREPFLQGTQAKEVQIPVETGVLEGQLAMPPDAQGLVLFAHGSGSSRFSSRNRAVAQYLSRHGFSTLLFDLLTASEEAEDAVTRAHRFDIPLLARRLGQATDWARRHEATRDLAIGYFGASTGAAAALMAAARETGDVIKAVVSRGGRPDLAGHELANVSSPVLLLVGSLDWPVIELNTAAYDRLPAGVPKRLEVIPGATHLFEEPGTLEQVAAWAVRWFQQYLTP